MNLIQQIKPKKNVASRTKTKFEVEWVLFERHINI